MLNNRAIDCVLCVNAVSVHAFVDVSVLMRQGSKTYACNVVMFDNVCHVCCVACLHAHLKALGADFFAFLHPGDSGFGLPGCLAHKRRNSARYACLVLRGFDETWQA